VQSHQVGTASGHVFRVDRKRGPVWYAKYRLPDGRQIQKRIGPAWTSRGRPAAGSFTRRTAQAWLDETLAEARAGTLAAQTRTGVLFSRAAEEWLRYAEHDRACKPTTMRDYRRALAKDILPRFGDLVMEDITGPMIEAWRSSLTVCARTKNKLLTILNGIFRRAIKAFGVRHNPVSEVERLRCRTKIELEVFSPEEVKALVRAAESEQDAAIYLTAAFTGLRRGELIALRWRDVDFAGSVLRVRASYAANTLTTPKSGKVRSVPLATEVAAALARLAASRTWSTGDDDLVFVGELGSYVDGSALRRRYIAALQRATLRPLRFHDLRHTFGTRMIAKADILRVKEWMGHADVQTTMRYLHFVPRPDDARLVDEAFADEPPASYADCDASQRSTALR
jgi:integrase